MKQMKLEKLQDRKRVLIDLLYDGILNNQQQLVIDRILVETENEIYKLNG